VQIITKTIICYSNHTPPSSLSSFFNLFLFVNFHIKDFIIGEILPAVKPRLAIIVIRMIDMKPIGFLKQRKKRDE
jgi:hypothetical protein